MDSGNHSHVTPSQSSEKGWVSDELLNIFVVFFLVAAAGPICFFGTIFNAINAIVFFKQGFQDTVNITLFFLAISDLGTLVNIFGMSICYNPWFVQADLPIHYHDLSYLTTGWLSLCFARISSWITAFVTFERCLCIALPLKVKTIITPRNTVIVILGIYVTMIVSVAPVYYAIGLGPKYFPQLNATKIGLVYISNGVSIENVSLSINAFSQLFSFFATITCTIILVHNLLLKSKWRQSSSSAVQQKSFSKRDAKVVKMIVFISSVFIACYLPSAVNFIATVIFDEYGVLGRYQNMFVLTWVIFLCLVATNSTVNIFVYYNMSSKFREILNDMLNIKRTET
ncbi:platelet-activating factor receptor-like [Aplysia californica]|uniref:Platelet-activating factor receptor-like n=1 Tax=Aplysia californica TaxID=6500 RepID=A0ABM1A3H5_APLCA|nr:platelet-activating factor receptor-like [Aplysia californica]